jgi:diacylglycerol O-acyltransferase / wax synthase
VPLTAPASVLNGVLTPHRRVAFASVPLADVKEVKEAFGVTVNDVVLAVCAGALRRYLDMRGRVPDKALLAAIPASVRTEDERGVMGNRVSAMFATLATQLDDPVDRLFAARDVMSGAKQVHEDIGGNTLHEWAEVAAPMLFSRGMRLYERLLEGRHPPIINLIVSNVPGPTFPLYCAGARLVSLFPLGPLLAGTGLNITVLSYIDSVGFGLIGCREIIPDIGAIAAAAPDALSELVKAAHNRERAAAIPSAQRCEEVVFVSSRRRAAADEPFVAEPLTECVGWHLEEERRLLNLAPVRDHRRPLHVEESADVDCGRDHRLR